MIEIINKILWAVATIMIFLNSIYFSIKLNYPQLKLKKIFLSFLSHDKQSKISPRDTLYMSLASKIGIGSLSGIAFAIFYGGIGTIFWIWIISLLTSINCFTENILATKYKEKDGSNFKGGPAYYIKSGLKNKKLAIAYSILSIITYIICFMTIQNNTLVSLVNNMYGTNKIMVSTIVTLLFIIIITKGIEFISKCCNKIVPIMSIIYIIVGIIIISINIDSIPMIFTNIIKDAFNSKAISGGIIYTFIIGIQKAIFSTESGCGTGAITAGTTESNDSIKQGYIGIISTYFISIVITTITAFIILLSDYQNITFSNINGIEITKYAFYYHMGNYGGVILLIILALFSFSTIITTYYYGESNLKNITNKKKFQKALRLLSIIILFIGGTIKSNIIWSLVNLFLAVLTIINLYVIYKLRADIISECNKKICYNKKGGKHECKYRHI